MHSEPRSQAKSHVAPLSQVTSHVEPSGHTNLHVLPFSQVSLHVRFVAQSKSQTWPLRQTQLFPQLPFEGPTAPSGFVAPEVDDEEEEEDDEEVSPAGPPVVEEAAVAPPSPWPATFQSYEHPKTRETPADATSVMTRRSLTPP